MNNENNKKNACLNIKNFLKIAFFIVSVLSIFTLMRTYLILNSTEIVQYQKNDGYVFVYQGNEYYKISEENKDKFSYDLYTNYTNFLDERLTNSEWKRAFSLGNVKTFIIPIEVRVIYDGDKPIILEENNHIMHNDFYLICTGDGSLC